MFPQSGALVERSRNFDQPTVSIYFRGTWRADGGLRGHSSRVTCAASRDNVGGACCGRAANGPTQTFIWKHGDQIIGRLSVPLGPAVKVYDYREGIVATLRYRDGASNVLQVGDTATLVRSRS